MATAEISDGAICSTAVSRDGCSVPHAVITVIDATGRQSAHDPRAEAGAQQLTAIVAQLWGAATRCARNSAQRSHVRLEGSPTLPSK